MKRFIAAFAVGATLIGIALVRIGCGLHPGRFSSLSTLLGHSATLVMGTAIIGSGMVGLADGYERMSRHLSTLLESRAVEGSQASVKSFKDLGASDQKFWAAYRNASFAVVGFMAAILVITASAVGLSHLAYLGCLITGVAIFGIGTLLISYQELRTIRQRHKQVGESAEILEAQPEKFEETPQPEHSQRRRWTIRRANPRYVVGSYRQMLRKSAQNP